MIGKPPKGQTPATPSKKPVPDVPGDEHVVPPRSDIDLPDMAHPRNPVTSVSPARGSTRLDSDAPTPLIRISMMPSDAVSVDAAATLASRPLSDFWISVAATLPDADAQGFRVYKRRQYVALADGHFVQVAEDPGTGQLRACLASERVPSGPIMVPDPDGNHWYPHLNPADAGVSALMSPSAVERRVRALYPELPDDEVALFIDERLQVDPLGVLIRLERESLALRDDLEIWSGNIPPHRSGSTVQWSAEALARQRQNREKFSQDLQAIWQRKSESAGRFSEEHFSSFLEFDGELPELSARFEYVTELGLDARNPGLRIGKFLKSFPNVRYLALENVRLGEFPPDIFQMRELRHLTLDNCSLQLSEATAEGLSRIETLTLLRLNDNPLVVAPYVGFMQQLQELYLRNSGLAIVPAGVAELRELRIVDLRGNDIVEVDGDLFDIPDTQNLFVNLSDNPLGENSRQRIVDYLENASLDRQVLIRTDDTDVEEVQFVTDSSDSGVDSQSE
ncbi:leucine-rich repeat domain-containing protein [Pseudomonas sp. LB3P14]